MTENEKRQAGLLFKPGDLELKAEKLKCHKLNQDYNALYEDQVEEREAILKEMLGYKGQGVFMQGPITFHYGIHTSIGDRTFINFNFTVQDDAAVEIGTDNNFGPNCTIVTPCHPMISTERNGIPDAEGNLVRLCYAKPVKIGNSCWFGANVVVCPGVTIGDNCVIGAGTVVTKDIPANSFAAGNPCRVIREISEADSIYRKTEVLGEYQEPKV